MNCDCKFDPDPEEPDIASVHFRRTCKYCNQSWWGLHCPHDKIQNPCAHCGVIPDVVQ
jgi:hypothetical protein